MEFDFPRDLSQNSTDTDLRVCRYLAEILETIQEMDDAFEVWYSHRKGSGLKCAITPSVNDVREHIYDTVKAKLGENGLYLIFGANCKEEIRDSKIKRKNLGGLDTLERKMSERGYHFRNDGTFEYDVRNDVRVVSNNEDGDETSNSHLSEGIGVSEEKGSYFEEYKRIMSERELHSRDGRVAYEPVVKKVSVVLDKEVSDEPKNKGKDMEGLEEFRRKMSAHGLHYRDGKVVYEPVVKKVSVVLDKENNIECKAPDLMKGIGDSKKKDNNIGESEELKTKLSAFDYQFGDDGLEDSDVEYLSAESDMDDHDSDETGKSDLMQQGIGDSKKEANNMGGLEESNRKMTDGGIEHEVNKVSMVSDKEDSDEPERSDAMVGIGDSKKEGNNMGGLEELTRKMTDGGEEHEVTKVSMASDKEDSDEPERSDAMVGIGNSKKEENNMGGQEELKEIIRACGYHLPGSEIEHKVIKVCAVSDKEGRDEPEKSDVNHVFGDFIEEIFDVNEKEDNVEGLSLLECGLEDVEKVNLDLDMKDQDSYETENSEVVEAKKGLVPNMTTIFASVAIAFVVMLGIGTIQRTVKIVTGKKWLASLTH